jgi:hypothetical protein
MPVTTIRLLAEPVDPPEPPEAERPAWVRKMKGGYLYAHIASPDVHVDRGRRRILMYFHGLLSNDDQQTRLAVSTDGLTFEALEPELDWEGADLPLATSVMGAVDARVRELPRPLRLRGYGRQDLPALLRRGRERHRPRGAFGAVGARGIPILWDHHTRACARI